MTLRDIQKSRIWSSEVKGCIGVTDPVFSVGFRINFWIWGALLLTGALGKTKNQARFPNVPNILLWLPSPDCFISPRVWLGCGAGALQTCGTAKHLKLLFKRIKCRHCLVMWTICVGFSSSESLLKKFFKNPRVLVKINMASPYTNCGLIVYLDKVILEFGELFSTCEWTRRGVTAWQWLVIWLVELEPYL